MSASTSLRTRIARNEPIGVVQIVVYSSAATDTDRTIIGKPIPGGTYKWFFTPGTVVPLMERVGASRCACVSTILNSTPISTRPTSARCRSGHRASSTHHGEHARARQQQRRGRLHPARTARSVYFVEEGDRSITLTLYGVRGNTDIINYATGDSMVKTIEWKQVGTERAIVTVNLRAAPYGYLVLWENGALVLKLRGRPAIDPNRPLAGLTIAVDPGHPPIGSTGPTGLYEGNATLPISARLKRILEERGARVVMTRTTEAAVALGDRPIIARQANAHAFVSIHLNAYPDGVNPFVARRHGDVFLPHAQRATRA